MIPLPFGKTFVLAEGDTQCLSNDVIAVAFEVFAVLLEFYDQFPVEFGLDALANRSSLLRYVRRHFRCSFFRGFTRLRPGQAWAGATPACAPHSRPDPLAGSRHSGLAPAHAPTLPLASLGP